jgi:hypothetical protein
MTKIGLSVREMLTILHSQFIHIIRKTYMSIKKKKQTFISIMNIGIHMGSKKYEENGHGLVIVKF